jgi:hypothetical protein
MGYYSFLTADTRESIPVVDSGLPIRTVHLLQPDGLPPISEPAYEGRGVFGGVECYEWIARMNLPADAVPMDAVASEESSERPLRRLTDDQLHAVGLSLSCGRYFVHPASGDRFCIFHEGPDLVDPTIVRHAITYSAPVPGYGRSANDMVADGTIEDRHFEIARPLKLSFDPTARYEDLPASEDCPHQGIYYPDEDDLDDDDDVEDASS